jgi:uncharacterized protein YaiE (UPF0345 family)
MAYEIKGDEYVRGHLRSRSFSLESLTITTVANGVFSLTASSPSNVFFIGSAQNQYLNLGDATTYEQGHYYNFMNDSSEVVFIRDFGLNVLAELLPNAGVTLQLEDRSNANGLWFIPQTELSKILVDLTNIQGIAGSNAQDFLENFLSLNGIPVIGEIPGGSRNCVNLAFTTSFEFIPGSLQVFLGGLRLEPGLDYTESVNNQGFTILINASDRNRLNKAPLGSESFLVNYSRRVIYP